MQSKCIRYLNASASAYDHSRIIGYLQQAGFYKEGEVTFPHKQSAVMKIKREYWEAPFL